MTSHTMGETLLLPHAGARKTTTPEHTGGLSTELLNQSVRRLRILALVYAFTFFFAGPVPNMLSASTRARFFAEIVYWIPDAIAIVMGLLVAAFTMTHRVSVRAALKIGLVFMVTGSYGIAVAEYINPARLDNFGAVGFSWVAIWTLIFSVIVPSPPRIALIVTLLSVLAVPIVIGAMILSQRTTFRPSPIEFFSFIVFPYLLIVVLAHVCQRVVYALGKEVTRARELGSYRLVERLGQGGMGEVWRATHRLLARPAAIKLLRPSVIGEPGGDTAMAAMRRFEREAKVTAQLRSPHTVELWDFGVADDGAFYYVMELLDGLDLETLVKRHGPVPQERVVYLLRQVCHSLTEAEACGLVHRDIKPANIFVCHYGAEYDFVKVLDFGIVKATEAAASLETGLMVTGENILRGTPAFIAPEQALGAADIDGRADIYATGCVAYWLLTGQLVFTADTVMGVLMHHAHTAPTPPSRRSEIPISSALEALIMSCLAKDPRERPQTARELSRRLGDLSGAIGWNEDRAREWWSTHEPAA